MQAICGRIRIKMTLEDLLRSLARGAEPVLSGSTSLVLAYTGWHLPS